MYIYIDETIHEQFGFMILAYVLCQEDPQDDLSKILHFHKKIECHALEKMVNNETTQSLRCSFIKYLNDNCKWGVFVLKKESRWNLVNELPTFITKLVANCSTVDNISIFLDEGIIKKSILPSIKEEVGIQKIYICASHEVNGIQLADLIAALNGVCLREEISQAPKILQYGKEFGFDPPIKAELGYELWATLRYSMYHKPLLVGEDIPYEFDTKEYGFFISDQCPKELSIASEKKFGKLYLGCIH